MLSLFTPPWFPPFFQIHHLAVNALLKSNQVNEMEGGALFGVDQDINMGSHGFNEQCGFDEATLCAPAFRVLRQLIQRCLADAVSSGNVFADAILQHLYRWLYRSQHLNLLPMPFFLSHLMIVFSCVL